MIELVIGDRAFSTWSLRPWLVLKRCGAEFTVREIALYGPDSRAELARLSPSGKVPLLRVGGETIWESLAIALWCAERFPDAGLWPRDERARRRAWSVTCEMHSGFAALRAECGMGPDAGGVVHTMTGPDRAPAPTSEAASRDVRRLVDIFRDARARFGAEGPYLFGEWSIPDAFFTPVAARVRHYGLDLARHGDDGSAAAYLESLLAQPDLQEWAAAAGH